MVHVDTASLPLGQMTVAKRIFFVLNSLIGRVDNCSIFADATLGVGYFVLVIAIWVTYHTYGLSYGSTLPETAQSVLLQSGIMILPLHSIIA